MKQKVDIVIIGGGPAGAVAGITAAQAGYSTLIVDKKTFPREKICGDGLAADSIRILKELNLWDQISKKGFLSKSLRFNIDKDLFFSLDTSVVTYKRERLDDLLFNHALDSGCEYLNAFFTGNLKENKSEILLTLAAEKKTLEICCKIVIFATGCQGFSFLNKAYNNKLKQPDLFAVRGYYKADWNLKNPEFFFDKKNPSAYSWIFPMGNDLFNIGCGEKYPVPGNLKSSLQLFVKNYATTNSMLDGKWVSSISGTALRTGLSNLCYASVGRKLLAGAALGATFPFSGEGIGKAMETGKLAAESAISMIKKPKIPKNYQKVLKKQVLPAYKPYKLASLLLTRSPSREILFSAISKKPQLRKKISAILNEEKGSEKVLSIKRILQFISLYFN
ncbi:MAG: NAD(P)/FAD-dependent oxidoreductase [Verrucomicrobiota bacterium]|nr:NAD(P)/FAD-dependent oxidoreductase [Verrucomicrobiota bacterium]